VIAVRLAQLFRSLTAIEALRAQARDVAGAGPAMFELTDANTKKNRESSAKTTV
jgi:hypothetical protein